MKACVVCEAVRDVCQSRSSRREVIHETFVRGFAIGSVLAELGTAADASSSVLDDFIANACALHAERITTLRLMMREAGAAAREAAEADTLPAPASDAPPSGVEVRR